VNTWAAYGGPAKIELISSPSARDSGLSVQFEPSTLTMEERSEAKAILKITAAQNVRNGSYKIPMSAKINDGGYIPVGSCDICLAIRIGNSSWHIQTFGSDTWIGQYGLGNIPDGLYLDLQTDKETYSLGEPIEIKTYIVNDGSESITLNAEDANRRLVTTIYGPMDEDGRSPGAVYGIDAYDFDGTESIVLQPKSKTLLVRSFVWDQGTMMWGVEPHQVPEGRYNIGVSFAGYNNAVLNAQHEVQISAVNGVE
jgi:hypothetical protein